MITSKYQGKAEDWEGKVTVHHDGDYSGDVRLVLPPAALTYKHQDGQLEVTLPFTLLKELVADSIRRARIIALEQAKADQILGC